jgi:hypothetical protein
LLDQQGNSCPRVKRYSLLSQEVYPALVTWIQSSMRIQGFRAKEMEAEHLQVHVKSCCFLAKAVLSTCYSPFVFKHLRESGCQKCSFVGFLIEDKLLHDKGSSYIGWGMKVERACCLSLKLEPPL